MALSKADRERASQAWLAFASAVVAGRSRVAFDDNGKVIQLDPEEVAEDAIVTANLLTRALLERWKGTAMPDLEDDSLPEEGEDEEEEEPEEDDEGERRGRRTIR